LTVGQISKYNPNVMRIKLKAEQLGHLAQRLPFEVMLDQARDVRGFLDILGKDMPWEETGLNKSGEPIRKPSRVAFYVSATDGGYVCDVHPAFASYISSLLHDNSKSE
jgi:hypothetical protein